jgi:hypothetical protein
MLIFKILPDGGDAGGASTLSVSTFHRAWLRDGWRGTMMKEDVVLLGLN